MAPRAAVREDIASLPQGSLAPVRVVLSRSIVAYYDPIRHSRGHAATSRPSRLYAAPSLCGSASATRETFPTFTAALSTRAVDPTPVGPRQLPVVLAVAVPDFLDIKASRHPQPPGSASNTAGATFSTVHRSLHATARVFLPGPPGWLRRDAITCSAPRLLRLRVTPAFDCARHQAPLGVRLKGRTGNLPSSGLSPDQFTAGSEAAP